MPKTVTVEADDADNEVPERSIREELEAARDEVAARQEEHGENESTPAPESPQGSAESRTRDARGQFAPTSGNAGNEPTPPRSQSPDSGTQQRVVADVPAPVVLPPPRGWSDPEKALWAKVPPEVQHVINRRETDVARKIAEQDEVRLVGKGFMEASTEYGPLIQARGGNPVALYREFLGILNRLQTSDPAGRAQLFQQVAAQNGVDLRVLAQPGPGAPAQPPPPPQVPLQTLVNTQVQQALKEQRQAEAREREQAEMQATSAEIETFRSKVNEHGQPAYPYFDHVTSLMASIIGSGTTASLEEAYQLAVKAHPETSKLIEQATVAAQKVAEEKRRKAEKARRAGGSIRGGIGGSPGMPEGNRSIRDELKAAFAEANARI
jgi:hypothetical protein